MSDAATSRWASPGPGIWQGHHYRILSLWDLMDRFHTETFLDAYRTAVQLQQMLEHFGSNEKLTEFRLGYRPHKMFTEMFDSLLAKSTELGFFVSSANLRRLIECLGKGIDDGELIVFSQNQTHAIKRFADVACSAIRDEFSERYVLIMPLNKVDLYTQGVPLLGQAVADGFRSAGFDIEEAGKCLALRRATASVFHLMRVMEIGIGGVRRCLGIPEPIKPTERNWGKILESVKKECDRRNTAGVPGWRNPADRGFFEEAYASLDAVRNPWRNSIMHVERKYTEEEAEHILAAVKGFMMKLATRLDENGKPDA